jgi:hypothetical protein
LKASNGCFSILQFYLEYFGHFRRYKMGVIMALIFTVQGI